MRRGKPVPIFYPALDAIIGRPRAVLAVTLAMMLAGLYVYLTLPREASPDSAPPVFSIILAQEGISAEDAESLLVKPMERAFRGLDGLKELTAFAAQGRATLVAEFDALVPQGKAFADLRETLARAKGALPGAAAEPVIEETSLGRSPVLFVALSGDVPDRTLNSHARQLKDHIEAIPAVLRADLAGQRDELIEIVVDPAKLESYAISQTELSAAAAANNRPIAAGSIDTGSGRFSVKLPGLFTSTRDILSLPVKASPVSVVTLGDIADIRRTFKDITSYGRVNGRPAVVLQIIKRPGATITATAGAVRQAVGEFTSGWPSALKVEYLFDQSEPASEVLGSLASGALTAIALVMIVTIASLGLGPALMVGLAIPAALLIGVLLLGLAGITVDRMVMFGLILSTGLLASAAINVVDYADREMAKGRGRRTAYRLAARHMVRPVGVATATTIAAFVPLLLWPGAAGTLLSGLPVTVICVLLASLFTAVLVLPALAGLIGGRSRRHREWTSDTLPRPKLLAGIARASVGGDAGGTLADGAGPGPLVRRVMPDPALNADRNLHEPDRSIRSWYAGMLARLFHHPGRVVAGSALAVALVFAAYASIHESAEFFVDSEPEQGVVLVSARGNLSAEEELALVKGVEAEVMQIPGIKSVFTLTGAPGGAGADARADQIGRIAVQFDDYARRPPGNALLAQIREQVAPVPGLQIEVRKHQTGSPAGKALRLDVLSDSLEDAQAVAGLVRDRLDQDRQLRDIDDTRPLPGIEWQLQVDRVAAAQFGADAASAGGAIQMLTDGLLLGRYRPADAEDEIEIRARFPADERGLGQLDRLTLRTTKGLVPISNFVDRQPTPRTGERIRKDRRYAVTLAANTVEGVRAGAKVKELGAWLAGGAWPDGVQFRFRGAHEDAREAKAYLKQAMVGALFLVFIILVVQFDSFYLAGAVTLSTAVLSVAGVLTGILLTGQAFSLVMTGAAMVALTGIGAANAIGLIDSFNRHRRLGAGVVDAALQGSAERLRPAVLTALTIVVAVLPMALQIEFDVAGRAVHLGSLGSIWWAQFSTALIFGLTFSTLLTLVLVPTLLVLPTVYADSWRKQREASLPDAAVAGATAAPALAHYSEAAEEGPGPVQAPDAGSA